MLQILQARIAEAADPLKEVYSFLHFFCLSLQLEVRSFSPITVVRFVRGLRLLFCQQFQVYFSQTLKLCRDRLDGHISVDDYAAGKCLSVSYWRYASVYFHQRARIEFIYYVVSIMNFF